MCLRFLTTRLCKVCAFLVGDFFGGKYGEGREKKRFWHATLLTVVFLQHVLSACANTARFFQGCTVWFCSLRYQVLFVAYAAELVVFRIALDFSPQYLYRTRCERERNRACIHLAVSGDMVRAGPLVCSAVSVNWLLAKGFHLGCYRSTCLSGGSCTKCQAVYFGDIHEDL